MSDKRNNKVQRYRLLQIDEEIRSGKFPNATSLSKKIEVSSRTIQRDIEYMRDMYNAPIEFDAYKNGYYYTEEGLKTHIASILKGKSLEYTINETIGSNWAEYLTITHPEGVEQWEGVIGLSTDITVSEDVKAEIAKLEKVLWWNDGKCYFYVPVEHFGGKVGVVRNHWYNLTINSIKGLGTPVADESEEIVPGKIEEETYFVAAQVQILKWKMVSQSVSLE